MGWTLLLGWWGIFAFLFRNPFAIGANLWALFAPPPNATKYGAANIHEVLASGQAGAAGWHDQGRGFDPMSTTDDSDTTPPEGFAKLSEDEVATVLGAANAYATLQVSEDASPEVIKAAYRAQVKHCHPDTGGDGGHDRMVELNAAYQILSNPHLRRAYDQRDAFADWMARVGAPQEEARLAWGCRYCRISFEDYQDLLYHAFSKHPGADMHDLVVELEDGRECRTRTLFVCRVCHDPFLLLHEAVGHLDQQHPGTDFFDGMELKVIDWEDVESNPASASPDAAASVWRCRTCRQTFAEYETAIAHADAAHPERVAVDVRTAVEQL
jgi:hypothetical protein